jgi:EPS-associated MarR family transcriptional regulator
MREEAYLKVMRLLQENPDLTQRELAERLGVSVGSVNYCLRALIGRGLVKVGNFKKSKNKFKYIYLLTPQGIVERMDMTSRFLKRKLDDFDALKMEIEALKAEVSEGTDEFNRQTL